MLVWHLGDYIEVERLDAILEVVERYIDFHIPHLSK
jgi:hypothetical protein